MNKTPEQMADKHANWRCPEQGPEFIVWCMCKEDFLAGYQAAQQWISVKDRLPEIGEWVLINGPEVCQRVAPPSSSWDWEFAWATDRASFYEPTDITHWMPLPTAPKEEV